MSWFNVSEFQFSHQDPDLCTIDIPAFIECPKVLGGLQFHWLSCKLVIQLYLFFYCKREGSFHKPSQRSLVLTLSHKLLIVLSLLYSFEGHQYNLESISLCCFYRHCFPPCFQMPEWAHQPQQSPPWEYFPRLLPGKSLPMEALPWARYYLSHQRTKMVSSLLLGGEWPSSASSSYCVSYQTPPGSSTTCVSLDALKVASLHVGIKYAMILFREIPVTEMSAGGTWEEYFRPQFLRLLINYAPCSWISIIHILIAATDMYINVIIPMFQIRKWTQWLSHLPKEVSNRGPGRYSSSFASASIILTSFLGPKIIKTSSSCHKDCPKGPVRD